MKITFQIILVLFLSYSTAFAQEALKLNSQAPNFEVISHNGKILNLEELSKKGPIVLTFYRGEWCPHCNLYMASLQDSLHLIEALNGTVIAITPENFENIDKTLTKSEAEFHVIYDRKHKIMDDYKVSYKMAMAKHAMYVTAGININKNSGNDDRVLPVPATYIIDQKQKIIGVHFDEDYSKRMPIKDILNILEKTR